MPQPLSETAPVRGRNFPALLLALLLCLAGLTACDRGAPEPEETEPPSPDPETEVVDAPAPEPDLAELEPVPQPQVIDESAGAADPAISAPPVPDVPTIRETQLAISEPSRPDGGQIDEGIYRNDFFGFSISLPDQWYPASPRDFGSITDRGTDLISGDDSATRAELEEAEEDPDNFQLLIVSKLPFDSTDVANPSIMIIAEKVADNTDGENYLQDLHSLLENSRISYTRQGEIGSETRSGITFFLADYQIKTPDAVLHQSYIVTNRQGYALTFIITDTDRASLSALRQFALNADFQPVATTEG